MTHNPDIPIYHDQLRRDFKKFLCNWNWELFITLSFNHRVNFSTAIKETKTWLSLYRTKLKGIKFAGIIMVVLYLGDHPHVHVLLTSDPAYPRTLSDHDRDNWKSPINLMQMNWDLSMSKIGTCC